MPGWALGTQSGQTSAVASRSSQRGRRWRGGPLLPLSPILPAVTLLLLCPALGRAFPPRDSEATASCFRPVPQAPAQTCVVNGLLEGAREALGPVSRAQGEEAVEGQGRVAGTGGRLDGYGGLPI